MKGIVFTEFLEMVEDKFSADTVDTIIEEADPPSGGAYTAVGTYDFAEMASLVTELSLTTGVGLPELLKTFGYHMAGRFEAMYPDYFAEYTSIFDFLPTVEDRIHIDVRKLYPDAELPTMICEMKENGDFTLNYQSSRPLADFAEGLISGCADYYKEQVTISKIDRSQDGATDVEFTLRKT